MFVTPDFLIEVSIPSWPHSCTGHTLTSVVVVVATAASSTRGGRQGSLSPSSCRLRFYVIMTSQRELFPRLTADMRRFKKLPHIYRDPAEGGGRLPPDHLDASGVQSAEQEPWDEAEASSVHSNGNEFYPLVGGGAGALGLFFSSPLFPLLNNEVASARRQIQTSVEQAMGHCRRDNLWRRLFHGENLDKLKLSKLTFSELEELLEAVQSRSVGEIDPQLVRFNQNV